MDRVKTHHVRWDTPMRRTARLLRAVCGEVVPRAEWSTEPSCRACREWLREYDALVIDPDGSMVGVDRWRPNEGVLDDQDQDD